MDDAVKQVPLVAETTLIGGARRQVRVLLDPGAARLAQSQPGGIDPDAAAGQPPVRRRRLDRRDNQEVVIETGGFLHERRGRGQRGGRRVSAASRFTCARSRRSSTARRSRASMCSSATGAADGREQPRRADPAVTLTIAKRPGANAIAVAHEVLRKVETLKGRVIPADVQVTITRHYGETAAEKSNELLLHMGIAVVGVSLLICSRSAGANRASSASPFPRRSR